jgi:hypothetical protein
MDYKKYSLEQLENWMYDAMSCGDATPQEIYDVIIEVVKDNYYTYKKQASEAYELLSLLNGNGDWTVEEVLKEKEYYEPSMPPWGHSDLEYMIHNKEPLSCDKDDPSPECKKSWTKFWEETPYPLYVSEDGDVWAPDYVTKEDKVKRWVLPTQVDGLTGDVIVNLPDDLLERAGLKEGDVIEWIDRKDGSFEMRKVNGTK